MATPNQQRESEDETYCSEGSQEEGCSFYELCKGESNYVCDPGCLVELTEDYKLEKAEKKIIKKIDDIFKRMKLRTKRKVKRFYIGKTHVEKNKRLQGRRFNPRDPESWKKEGISSKWGIHREEEYGRDGMIVVAVITGEQVPIGVDIDHEQYTLALEQRLLHHYKITEKDKRLHNKTFASNAVDCDYKDSPGYALYVAFSQQI